MHNPDIGADQGPHAAPPDPGIDPVGFGAVMAVDVGLEGLDNEIGIVLPLPVPEFPVVVGAVFLDPFLPAMVDTDHDQLTYSPGRQLHKVPVDRPAAKRCILIKEVLGILQVQDRVILPGVVIIMGKQGPDPPVFPQLWNLKPSVDQLNNRVMRHRLRDMRRSGHLILVGRIF